MGAGRESMVSKASSGENPVAIQAVQNLAAVLRGGEAIPTEQAVDIFRQLAEQVAALHLRGTVHREICPERIQFDPASGKLTLDEPRSVVTFGGSLADQ